MFKQIKLSGSVLVFLGAVFWSLNSPLVKYLPLNAFLICGLRSVIAAAAQKDAAAGVGVAFQISRKIHAHKIQTLLSVSSLAASSAAAGRRTHSACSITRRWRISGVSPGRTSTAFWAMISPPSGISLT